MQFAQVQEFEQDDDEIAEEQQSDIAQQLKSKLRPIETNSFNRLISSASISKDRGQVPAVTWLPIAALRVNDDYQRNVLENGRSNVIYIAKHFKWHKFGIVIVVANGDGTFSIVDGQHRTIGAKLHGIDEVPCLIFYGLSVEQQAEMFAALNGKVTAVSPLAIFHAELKSGDPVAKKIVDLCAEAKVTICRYVKPSSQLARGETIAINTIKSALRIYPDKVVKLALKSILQASKDHNDLLNSNVIMAMCQTLDSEGTFRVPEYRLSQLMEEFDLHKNWVEAHSDAKMKRKYVAGCLSMRIFKYLDGKINS